MSGRKFLKRLDEEGIGGTWWQVWEAEQEANGNWVNRECVATFCFESHADLFVAVMNIGGTGIERRTDRAGAAKSPKQTEGEEE